MGVPRITSPRRSPDPVWPDHATAHAPANTKLSAYWDTNTVWIPLNNGTVQRTTYNDNLNPWRNQHVRAVAVVPGRLAVQVHQHHGESPLRFNVDFFNVFNHPNNPPVSPAQDTHTRNSDNDGRITQLSLRLNW